MPTKILDYVAQPNASSSLDHAAQIYAQGKLLSSEKGAWLHIIKN